MHLVMRQKELILSQDQSKSSERFLNWKRKFDAKKINFLKVMEINESQFAE